MQRFLLFEMLWGFYSILRSLILLSKHFKIVGNLTELYGRTIAWNRVSWFNYFIEIISVITVVSRRSCVAIKLKKACTVDFKTSQSLVKMKMEVSIFPDGYFFLHSVIHNCASPVTSIYFCFMLLFEILS